MLSSTFMGFWIIFIVLVCVQLKYKTSLKKDLSSSLFHQLPETFDTVHAKEVSELLSEVSAELLELGLVVGG